MRLDRTTCGSQLECVSIHYYLVSTISDDTNQRRDASSVYQTGIRRLLFKEAFTARKNLKLGHRPHLRVVAAFHHFGHPALNYTFHLPAQHDDPLYWYLKESTCEGTRPVI